MPAFVRKNYGFIWMLLSIAVFVIGLYFTVGFGRVSQPTPTVAAGTVTWDGGGGDGLWNTATNWDTNVVPDSTNDVIIIDGVTTTVATGQTANFSTLQIGQGTATTTLVLVGNIGTGGSITVKNHGVYEQQNSTSQTITGTLTVESGGYVQHTYNTTAQSYILDMSAAAVNVQSGGVISADGKGYTGGSQRTNGNGPGGGATRTTAASGHGSGGGHAGNGGDNAEVGGGTGFADGGTGYCDVTDPSTIGSGGGGVGSGATVRGGSGGGLIRFNVSGTFTLNGSLVARGIIGTNNGSGNGAGSGSGGGVKIVADTIAGTPTLFSVAGGNGNTTATGSGGGGGGCVLLSYTTSNSIAATAITMSGGTSSAAEYGGAGVVYIKPVGGIGDLFSTNAGTAGAQTTLGSSAIVANSLTLKSYADYSVTSTKSVTLHAASPFSSGDGTGTFRAQTGGTFTPTTTGNFTIASSTFELWSTATLTSSSSLNVIVGSTVASTTFDLRYFTTSTFLNLASLTIGSKGIFTHGANSSTQEHVIALNATTFTLQSGGFINVNGKGYGAAGQNRNGKGPGGGFATSTVMSSDGSGAGHAGNGGSDNDGHPGGTAYCDITNVQTIGSGGAGPGTSASGDVGGRGGGLVYLNISGTATFSGAISADGQMGSNGGAANGAGGGAGGGVNITANVIAGTPSSFSIIGGPGNSTGTGSGAGGGGCALLTYTTSNSIAGTSITMNGGSSSVGQYGGAGVAYIKKSGTNGDLFSINGGTSGGETPQAPTSVTANSLTIKSKSEYVVTSTHSLVLLDADPFVSSDGSGTIRVSSGTFTPTTTANFTLASTTLELWSNATLTSSSSLNMIIGPSVATSSLDMRNFTTTVPLRLSTLIAKSGSIITHGFNTTAQSHIVNISATTIEIQSGAQVNVDGRGYSGGSMASNGNGPVGGVGVYGSASAGSGGAHGGNGGADVNGDAGGTAYCTTSSPATIGAGGAGGSQSTLLGGNGGGLIIFTTTGALTVNGTITADGWNGVNHATTFDAGGGGGGGVKFTAGGAIVGTPTSFTATGGSGNDSGGGGGGGCVFLSYSSSNSISSTTVTGGTGFAAGSTGASNTYQSNQAPTATAPTVSAATDGTGYVSVYTSVDDGDDNSVSLKVEYKSGSCAAYSGQVTTTLSSTVTATYGQSSIVLNNNASNGYQISTVTTTSGVNTVGFTWLSDTDASNADATYCLFITPTDGTTAGTTVSSTVTLDNVSPSSLGNLTATGNTGTTLTLTYGASATDTHEPSSNAYRMYYKQGSSGVTTSDTEIDSTNFDHYNYGGGTSVTVSSLSLDTQYVFNIYAYDTYGNSTSATEVATTTRANEPDTPSVVARSMTSLAVSWGANSNPATVSYYIEDVDDSARNSGWISSTNYTFSNLTAETGYRFKVKAKNSAGTETSFTSMSSVEYTTGLANTNGGSGNPGNEKKPFGQIKIADTAHSPISATNDRDILILISPTDAATMKITENNNPLSADFSAVVSQPVAYEKDWILSSGDGLKCLHVQFANAGNTATYIATPACVTLDETAPEAPVVTTIFTGDASHRPYVEGSGETGAQVALTHTGAQSLSAARHAFLALLGAKKATYTTAVNAQGIWRLTFTDYFVPGKYGISVTQTDKAKNVSRATVTTMTVQTSFSSQLSGHVTLETANGKEISVTNNPEMYLHIVSTGAAQYVGKRTSSKDTPSFVGEAFQNIPQGSFRVPLKLDKDGYYCFHIRFIGEIKTATRDDVACVLLDRVAPPLEFVRINHGATTQPPEVAIKTEDNASVVFSYSLVSPKGQVGEPIETHTKLFKESTGAYTFGKSLEKNIYEFSIQAQDAAGNVSSILRKRVFLENAQESAPDGSLTVIGLRNGVYTNKTTVSFNLTAANATTMRVAQGGKKSAPSFAGYVDEGVSAKRSIILSPNDGEKCIYVRLQSKNGTRSKDISTCFILDTTPPARPAVESISQGTRKSRAVVRGKAEPFSTVKIVYKKTSPISRADVHITLAALDIARLSVPLAAGEQGIGTVVADAKGNWEFTLPGDTPGQYSLSVSSEDQAGNTSPAVSGSAVVIEVLDIKKEIIPVEPPKEILPKEVIPEVLPVLPKDTTNPLITNTPGNEGDAVNNSQISNIADTIGAAAVNLLESTQAVAGNIIVNAQQVAANIFETVSGVVEPILSAVAAAAGQIKETAAVATRAIQTVTDNPAVEEVNKTVAVPVVAVAAVANAAASGIPELITFLRFLFGQPLLLLRRRRMKRWGTIYNSFTKQPVDLAMIRLFDTATNRLVRSQVTDTAGRYLLIVNPGSYRLEVVRPGYAGFSEYLHSSPEDGTYTNLYHGQQFNVTEKNTQVSFNIPLDPTGKSLVASQVIRDHALKSLQYVFSLAGIILGMVSFIISPTPFVFGIFVFHVFLYGLFYLYAHRSLPPAWGVVTEADGETPLPNAVVRLFDVTYNKLVDTKVTDKKGRYAFLVGSRSYYVTYEKPGYTLKKSPILDYATQTSGNEGSVVARNEKLALSVAAPTIRPEPPMRLE